MVPSDHLKSLLLDAIPQHCLRDRVGFHFHFTRVFGLTWVRAQHVHHLSGRPSAGLHPATQKTDNLDEK